MNPVTSPPQRPLRSLAAGVLGGLVVLVVGAILIATGAIGGETKREVVRETLAQPVSQSKDGSGGNTIADIYRKEGPGVVYIQARGVSGNSPFGLPQQGSVATGSGFVLDNQGYILTNDHVVEGSSNVTVRFSENGNPIKADVKGRDPSSDLAVLKVDPSKAKLDPLPLGDSSKAQVGDAVVAIGNPFGLQRTVTSGIVSAVQRHIEAPNNFTINGAIQTDAAINPGNSGGPLIDANGRVIGINSQIATGGGNGSVGIGFAVPINLAKRVIPQLEKGGTVQRAYLGVEMATVTSQIAKALKLPTDHGALIQRVIPGGPAAKAGLRGGHTPTGQDLSAGGDLIVKVGGKDVRSSDGVAAAIASKKPGDVVNVQYYRGTHLRSTSVKLGKRPSQIPGSSSDQGGGGGDILPFP
ncbi:MAG TPA: trypsin-like peptidase domain-containing protein [Thermoleophilaceae bacterium]|nr:trypsin-like peptidase domain-containing protein [Thermoleophilaceae bacterium]